MAHSKERGALLLICVAALLLHDSTAAPKPAGNNNGNNKGNTGNNNGNNKDGNVGENSWGGTGYKRSYRARSYGNSPMNYLYTSPTQAYDNHGPGTAGYVADKHAKDYSYGYEEGYGYGGGKEYYKSGYDHGDSSDTYMSREEMEEMKNKKDAIAAQGLPQPIEQKEDCCMGYEFAPAHEGGEYFDAAYYNTERYNKIKIDRKLESDLNEITVAFWTRVPSDVYDDNTEGSQNGRKQFNCPLGFGKPIGSRTDSCYKLILEHLTKPEARSICRNGLSAESKLVAFEEKAELQDVANWLWDTHGDAFHNGKISHDLVNGFDESASMDGFKFVDGTEVMGNWLLYRFWTGAGCVSNQLLWNTGVPLVCAYYPEPALCEYDQYYLAYYDIETVKFLDLTAIDSGFLNTPVVTYLPRCNGMGLALTDEPFKAHALSNIDHTSTWEITLGLFAENDYYLQEFQHTTGGLATYQLAPTALPWSKRYPFICETQVIPGDCSGASDDRLCHKCRSFFTYLLEEEGLNNNGLSHIEFGLICVERLTVVVENEIRTTGYSLNDGKWHHVAVTYGSHSQQDSKGKGYWCVYVDGESVGGSCEGDTKFTTASDIRAESTSPMYPGYYTLPVFGHFHSLMNGSPHSRFVGKMWGLNVFSIALRKDIIQKMATGCKQYCGDLVSWGERDTTFDSFTYNNYGLRVVQIENECCGGWWNVGDTCTKIYVDDTLSEFSVKEMRDYRYDDYDYDDKKYKKHSFKAPGYETAYGHYRRF